MEIVVIDYLGTPPDTHEIERALMLLRMQPRQLLRTNEREYKTLHLDDVGLTRAQLIAAMHAHPSLIQRPIVFTNGKACVGRPPTTVLDIL
jgi:arsenate reductase (glutaredoxin)